MQKKHVQWAVAFVAGTFLGGWVLGVVGTILGRFTGGGKS